MQQPETASEGLAAGYKERERERAERDVNKRLRGFSWKRRLAAGACNDETCPNRSWTARYPHWQWPFGWHGIIASDWRIQWLPHPDFYWLIPLQVAVIYLDWSFVPAKQIQAESRQTAGREPLGIAASVIRLKQRPADRPKAILLLLNASYWLSIRNAQSDSQWKMRHLHSFVIVTPPSSSARRIFQFCWRNEKKFNKRNAWIFWNKGIDMALGPLILFMWWQEFA